MTPYSELSREQLIEKLSFVEQLFRELSISSEFKQSGKSRLYKEDIPMSFVRADGVISYVNNALCDITGFIEGETLGRHVSDFIFGPNSEWHKEMLAKMVAGECELFRDERELSRKSGIPIYLDILIIAIRDEKGKFLKAMYIFSDISASKQSERELTDLLDTQKRIADSLMLMMQNETGNYENEVLQIILERYNADRAYIFKFDWKNGCNSNVAEVVAAGISCEIDNLQHIPNTDVPDMISYFERNEPFILNSVVKHNHCDSIEKDILLTQNIQSVIDRKSVV